MKISTRRGLPFILCAILFAVRPALSQPQELLEQPLIPDTSVISGVLDNGLRYYVKSNRRPEQRAELRLAVKAGSILERDNEKGLAHFLEHMAFNGTKNYPKQALVDFIESLGMRFGANLNAGTGFDQTIYILTIPTQPRERVGQALQVLEDWAHLMAMEPEEIEKERGVIVEEWRLGLDADNRIWEKQSQVLFSGSRYAERRPIGDTAVIKHFPPKRLIDFYRRWYRPDLMAVVAVGDFDGDSVAALIRQEFSQIPRAAKPEPRPFYPLTFPAEPRYSIVTDPEATGAVVSLNVLLKPDTLRTVGDLRQKIVNDLLSTMFNQRLEEIKRKPRPPFLEAQCYRTRYVDAADIFTLAAEVADDGMISGIEALMLEAKRARLYGFGPAELARAKAELLRQWEQRYLERDKTESRRLTWGYVSHFLRANCYLDPEQELRLARLLLPGIELEDINNLARSILSSPGKIFLASGPERAGLKIPSLEEWQGRIAAAEQSEVAPYVENLSRQNLMKEKPRPGRVRTSRNYSELGIVQWTLANGVRVYLKPTNFKNDEIVLRSFAWGGTSLADSQNYFSARYAAQVVAEAGVGDFDRTQLEKFLSGKIVEARPWIQNYDQGINASASPADLETMLQLVHLYFTAPRCDSAAFASFIARTAASLRHREADPENALRDSLQLILGGHSYRARPANEEMISRVDLGQALDFYRQLFSAAFDQTFFLVGSFRPDSIRPLVETYLGSLPQRGRLRKWRDPGIRYPRDKEERIIHKGLEPKSAVRLAYVSDMKWNREARLLAGVVSDYLDIKLREVVREEKGGTYSIWTHDQATAEPVPQCAIHIGLGCDPDRAEELTQTIEAVIDTLRERPIPGDYLERIIQMNLKEWETRMKENQYWASQMMFGVKYKEDLDGIRLYPRELRNVTPEKVLRAARNYLQPSRRVKVVLYPEKSAAEIDK